MRTLVPALAVALSLTLAACTGGAGSGSGSSGLTPDKLEEAKGSVRAMQPKAEAMTALEGALGKPATTDDSSASWFAKDGDACKELHVQLMGDMVGNVELKKSPCPE